jgi:hypothetical protein
VWLGRIVRDGALQLCIQRLSELESTGT